MLAAKVESMREHLMGNLWTDIESFIDEKIVVALRSKVAHVPLPEQASTVSHAAGSGELSPQHQDDVHEQRLRRREQQQVHGNSSPDLPSARENAKENSLLEEANAFEAGRAMTAPPVPVGWEKHEREVRELLQLEGTLPPEEKEKGKEGGKAQMAEPVEVYGPALSTQSLAPAEREGFASVVKLPASPNEGWFLSFLYRNRDALSIFILLVQSCLVQTERPWSSTLNTTL